MKRLIGSILGVFFISVLLSGIFPGICLMTFLSTSGAGGFSQKDCIDTFWSFFKIVFSVLMIGLFVGLLFKMKWVSKIDIFQIFKV
jgi:hypothetical protein